MSLRALDLSRGLFQSAPCTEVQGDICRERGCRYFSPRFNPLPYLSTGRYAITDPISQMTMKFQSAPLTGVREDSGGKDSTAMYLLFQSASRTEVQGGAPSQTLYSCRCRFNPLPTPEYREIALGCSIDTIYRWFQSAP